MKKRSVILSFVLAIMCVLSVFTFTGCKVTTQTLEKSFNSLEALYEKYDDVFIDGEVNGQSSKYLVNYSDTINSYISSHREGFDELDEVYNTMLDLSARYVDENKLVILNYNEKSLSKAAKKSFKTLNKSIKNHKKQIKRFVSARKSLVFYFDHFDDDGSGIGAAYHLRVFKKAYAKFASSSIALANSLAKTIEKTEIYDYLRVTETTESDVGLVKGYIEMKLLKVYNSAILKEIASKLDWETYKNKNERLKDLVASMNTSLDYFTGHIAGNGGTLRLFDRTKMTELLDKTEEFVVESKSFLKAVYDFNFAECAKYYDNNLEKYARHNKFALIDIDKMEQFINITIANFMQEVEEYIYQ